MPALICRTGLIYTDLAMDGKLVLSAIRRFHFDRWELWTGNEKDGT